MFERVIFNQIHEYFNLHNLYYGNQYGFRKGHSTELAILEVIDRVTLSLDIGVTPINIYLDLSNAFDTLNHDILLQKLKHYGIHGRVVKGVGHLGHDEVMEAGGREFDPRPGHYSRMSF